MVRKLTTKGVEHANCPSREVLELIANKWTVLVLHVLSRGTRRYSELEHDIEGITQKMLTSTLRKLERDGLVERTIYPVVPPKVEYELTKLGKSLLETVQTLTKWAETHIVEVEKARTSFAQK